MLQLSVTVELPVHSAPPFSAATLGSLLFVRTPPPQDLSHSPIFQLSHSQSTAFSFGKIKRRIHDKNSLEDSLVFFERSKISRKIGLMDDLVPGQGSVLHSSISVGWPVQVPP